MRKVRITKGNMEAPSIFVNAIKHTEAEKEARGKGGLGKYEEWKFEILD